MKKQFRFLKIFVFLFLFPAFVSFAAEKSPSPKSSAKASSLWGIRRGPKAPKTPAPTPTPPVDDDKERARQLNKYYEEKVKGMYGGPQPGSPRKEISITTGSENCAPEKK